MSLYRVTNEEHYEPWDIAPVGREIFRSAGHDWSGELPDALVERFQKAKTEIEALWNELRWLMREDQ